MLQHLRSNTFSPTLIVFGTSQSTPGELTIDLWYKKFGNIYSFRLGNQLVVAVSDPRIVKDLMVTNSAVFSPRKDMFVKAQTIFLRRAVTSTRYNHIWRKQRRIAHSYLQQRSVNTFIPGLDYEAVVLVKNLFDDNGRYAGRCLLNNMLTITFGIRSEAMYDPTVTEVLRTSREFMNCTGPMSNLVDYLPLLQYLQSPMQSRGIKLRKAMVELYGDLIKQMDSKIRAGEPVPECFARKLLEVKEEEMLDDLDIIILLASYNGSLRILSRIQKKVHDELDRVVGCGRFPTVEDQADQPYCPALIQEGQRYHNPFWLGTPHAATQDSIYEGYYTPKDTMVICNTYSMHFNAIRYPDPFTFNPDRYVQDNLSSAESANLADPYKRDHWMFGVGRRICIGMLLADKKIFLAISRMLWSFNMAEVPGEPIDLKEYDGWSRRSPLPFRINITPRHEGVAEVLNALHL
ncbi:cytochrome P450 [Mycena capillaripes]|nr:cytochrome P450 [Mycena capillaripes]